MVGKYQVTNRKFKGLIFGGFLAVILIFLEHIGVKISSDIMHFLKFLFTGYFGANAISKFAPNNHNREKNG